MISISEMIKENGIVEVQSRRKPDALREILQSLAYNQSILQKDISSIHDSLLERERLGSTGIGDGVAFPHVRISFIKKIIVTMGRSKDGIDWESMDGKPVNIVWLILVPDFDEGSKLRALSRLQRLIKNEIFRTAIIESDAKLIPIVVEEMERESGLD